MKQKALAREDRKRQILHAFMVHEMAGNEGGLTVADIARYMHLSVSTKLRNMVMEWVIDGTLDFVDEPIPGVAKFRRIYSPNQETFNRPTPQYKGQGRAIKFNSRQGSFFAQIGGQNE